jgi:hypothetical protein
MKKDKKLAELKFNIKKRDQPDSDRLFWRLIAKRKKKPWHQTNTTAQ